MDVAPRRSQKWLQRKIQQKPRTSRCSEVEVTDQRGTGKSQWTVAHKNAIAFWSAWCKFFEKSDRIFQIRSRQDSRFHRPVHKETLQFIEPIWTRAQHEKLAQQKQVAWYGTLLQQRKIARRYEKWPQQQRIARWVERWQRRKEIGARMIQYDSRDEEYITTYQLK
jgi:hypothetical protein